MKESLKRRQHQIEHLPQVYPYPSINKKKQNNHFNLYRKVMISLIIKFKNYLNKIVFQKKFSHLIKQLNVKNLVEINLFLSHHIIFIKTFHPNQMQKFMLVN